MISNSSSISVATSLVPNRNVELQRAAVNSWLDLGFSVLSLNAESEAASVAQHFPGITVKVANRTAPKAVGKPLPLITDLLHAAIGQNNNASVVGFINSDIFLQKNTDFARILVCEGDDALILLPRIDVQDIDSAKSFAPKGNEKFSVGYDGVFLPPGMIDKIPQSLFCIGMPFWDYWLPLMMLLQNIKVKTIASPVALHVAHATEWDQSIYLFFHTLMSDALKVSRAENNKNVMPILGIVLDMLQHSYDDIFKRATQPNSASANIDVLASFYDRLQEVIVHHIKLKAEPIFVPDIAHIEP